MTIKVGDRLPDVTLRYRENGEAHEVSLGDRLKGRKVVIFGLPGAFTGTCSTAHLPSFVRTAEAFRAKGVDEIICISVNDIWVMEEWDRQQGAGAAGITMLADTDSAYAKGTGLAFSAPPIGFHDRIVRHALVAEDGVVTVLQIEEARGVCELTAGETLLDLV